jgi:hypothetical protein
MESVNEWLNENELRAYPLLESGEYAALPENLLIDLILMVSSDEIESAKLLSISRQGTKVIVVFTGTDNTFEIDTVNVSAFPLYVRNPGGSLAVFGEGLRTFVNTQADNSTLSLNLTPEHSTVYDFTQAWLGVVSLGITAGFRSQPSSFKPILPLESLPSNENVLVSGEVQLTPGFNYHIDFLGEKINMRASFGLGEQMTCQTEFVPPELKDCSDIVSFINGISPESDNIFRMLGSTNVNVFDGSSVNSVISDTVALPNILNINENVLFVGLTFLETDLCSPVELLPTNN